MQMDVKTLCLGVLTLGDATGYEIRKQFVEGPFSHFYDAGYGSIYPALGRLLADGLVSVRELPQDGRPDKKIYSLTEKGMLVFKAALTEPPVRDKVRSEHVARLFFAEHMEADVLKSVYDSYLNELREMATQIRVVQQECLSSARQYTCGLGLAFYEGAEQYMERHREDFFKSIQDVGNVLTKTGESNLDKRSGNEQ
jgi:DNA-binding PadR family transcriptional regulator